MEFRLELNTTTLLILANIILYILSVFLSPFDSMLFEAGFLGSLDFLGADKYSAIIDGEIWRLITSSFLHANILHLFVNMYALYYFGNYIERQYGGKKLTVLYVIAGFAGSFLSFLITYLEGLMGMSTFGLGVGASGALFGILGYMITAPNYLIDKQRLYSIIILNLFIGFVVPSIDNWAHIGGLLAGILLGAVDKKELNGEPTFVYNLSIVVLVLSFLALIIFNIYNLFTL